MKQFLFHLYIYSLIFLIYGCANQVTPTGGEKDLTPPGVKNFTPYNYSVFFNAQEIEIEFDEYFQATDIFNQIVISPPMESAPDVKVRGKKLKIIFNGSLRDSTTYTINFGESIKDITEGNVLENFTYVFSTGSYIDSLTIKGNVSDILTGKPAEKIYVVLYPTTSDTLFTTTKPYYFAKTNSVGEFQIYNIKEGAYNLYAIEDQNFNYYYDLPNERIAFADSVIFIDTTTASVQLNLFSEDKTEQNILAAKSYRYGQSQIVFSDKTDSVKVQFEGEKNERSFFEKNKAGDTMYFWHPDVYLSEHLFRIQFDTIDTILSIDVKSLSADSIITKNKNTFSCNAMPVTHAGSASQLYKGWDLSRQIDITFSNPIDSVFKDKFLVFEDTTKNTVLPEIFIDSLHKQNLTLRYNWLPEKNYMIQIQEGATKDIFGLRSDSASYYIQTKKNEDYGTIVLTIYNNQNSKLIIEFLKQDLSVLNEKNVAPNAVTPLTYQYLLPGKYFFRAIKDDNKNGRWDTGNLSEKKQPEQIIYFSTEITVKANWEMELKWVID